MGIYGVRAEAKIRSVYYYYRYYYNGLTPALLELYTPVGAKGTTYI